MMDRAPDPDLTFRLAAEAEPAGDVLSALADLLIGLNEAEPRKHVSLLEQHEVVAGRASSGQDLG